MFNSNSYYEGRVQSIGFETSEGKASVGVMAEGAYEFGTSQKEIMTFTSGLCEVMLPGSNEWTQLKVNESFEVAAKESFKVRISQTASYICLYR